VTTTHTLESRVRVPTDVLVRVINGESFILNVQTECYFGLNAVGARMFELLGQSPSVRDAFNRLRVEYEVDPDTLQLDFDRLIAELLQQGLLELHSAPVA
jgi:Coenzyme PQQ synthesis protein D (PqqD)